MLRYIGYLLLHMSLPAFAAQEILCPRFVSQDGPRLHLNNAEKNIICGDPKNPAWSNIPDNQAIFHLQAFLQQRGYYHPSFDGRDGKIFIRIGDQSRIKIFTLKGAPPELEEIRFRRVVGEILTPSLLDETKSRLQQRLQSLGYACPKISVSANEPTGELIANIQSGSKQKLIRVEEDPVEDLHPNLFSRYRAFVVGETYNRDYLNLTTERIIHDSIVQSSYFTTTCTDEGAITAQKFVAGPPRLFRIAGGVDTERLLIGRVSWKNARMGYMGSSLELAAAASFRDQSFTAQSMWYVLPYPSRFHLRPFFLVQHENIRPYEQVTGKLQLSPATSLDWQEVGLNFYVGPRANFTRTYRGNGPAQAWFLSFISALRLTEHYFDFYRSSPRSGFDALLEGEFTVRNLLSGLSAQKLRLSFAKLWNWKALDPPFLVLGFRGQLTTVLTEETLSSGIIPNDFRYFLGGSPDLRGFSYRELPDEKGALSLAAASLEVRFADLFPWKLQPFLFIDGGMSGPRPVLLDNRLYWSPGWGMRWESPIGVMRASLAHGFVNRSEPTNDSHSHWQFYFSFGEEF